MGRGILACGRCSMRSCTIRTRKVVLDLVDILYAWKNPKDPPPPIPVEVRATLKTLLRDDDEKIRKRVAEHLLRDGEECAVDPLVEMAHETGEAKRSVQLDAAMVLGYSSLPRALDAVM